MVTTRTLPKPEFQGKRVLLNYGKIDYPIEVEIIEEIGFFCKGVIKSTPEEGINIGSEIWFNKNRIILNLT